MAEFGKVCVLGAGSWGTGLAVVAAGRAASVALWDIDREVLDAISQKNENTRYVPGVKLDPKLAGEPDVLKALDGADAIVLALPVVVIEKVLSPLRDAIPPATPIVSASKGLSETQLRFPTEIIRDALGRKDRSAIFALSGPSFAKETARGLPTAVAFAGESLDAAARCAELFHAPTFRTYPSDDLVGVEAAGAFKNVIAIAAGAVDGLGYGDNARAAIITRGSAEITRVGMHFGAKPSTFQGLAGMGDLLLTCTSQQSRNCRLGYLIAKGKTLEESLAELGETAEGMYTAKAARKLSSERGLDLPISNEIYAALYEGKPAREVAESLMSRPMRQDVEH
jgi:glycerol-3-phosphate dehydrogenase (NAD(P)+)